MKKVYLDYLYSYPKKEVYVLSHLLGRRLVDFLGEEGFCLLLDSRVLIYSRDPKEIWSVRDKTYKLHSVAKGLEFFLKKLINGQKLKRNDSENIPNTFDNSNEKLSKIKNRKLILRTKSTWEFCRNEIMHPSKLNISSSDVFDKYDEIIYLIVDLFKDFYGKSEPDYEINVGFKDHFMAVQNKLPKKSFLSYLLNYFYK